MGRETRETGVAACTVAAVNAVAPTRAAANASVLNLLRIKISFMSHRAFSARTIRSKAFGSATKRQCDGARMNCI